MRINSFFYMIFMNINFVHLKVFLFISTVDYNRVYAEVMQTNRMDPGFSETLPISMLRFANASVAVAFCVCS